MAVSIGGGWGCSAWARRANTGRRDFVPKRREAVCSGTSGATVSLGSSDSRFRLRCGGKRNVSFIMIVLGSGGNTNCDGNPSHVLGGYHVSCSLGFKQGIIDGVGVGTG